VQDHLRELSLLNRFDGVLAFTAEQHHLAMLGIELMSRACGQAFRAATRRLTVLPHCLRDLEVHCRAAVSEIDDACRGCSQQCSVNTGCTLLRRHRIEPSLWMQADVKKLFRRQGDVEGGPGVMGIARAPWLVRGTRMCAKRSVAYCCVWRTSIRRK
jgi:Protein of unknown function DUF116